MKHRLCVSLALLVVLIPCFAAPAAAATDLSAERSTLSQYVGDLRLYYKDAGLLSKKTALILADVDALQRRSDGLRSRSSGAQSTIGSVVRKLKAAAEFDAVDEVLAKKITDSRKRSFLLQSSFEGFLEQSASNLSSSADGLNVPVDSLRRKLSGSTSGTGGAVTNSGMSQLCASAKALVGIMILVGTEVDAGTWDIFSCACSYAAGQQGPVGLGTATSCVDVITPLI